MWHLFESTPVVHTTTIFAMVKAKEKSEIKAYIKTRGALNISATQIHFELCDVYRSSVVSFSTVYRWLHKFSKDKTF